MRILILSALPQEYLPLKRDFALREVRRNPRKLVCTLPDKEIHLVECGMGANSTLEALSLELALYFPDLLIFSGFAGGLHPDLSVGDVCFAVKATHLISRDVCNLIFTKEFSDFLVESRIKPVEAFSANSPADKRELSALALGKPAVLDMETAMLAKTCLDNKVPFVCFRAISDAMEHDLGFNLSDIADERGRVIPGRVLALVIRKPGTLKAFYLAWRRSSRAAKNLCGAVGAMLKMPTSELRRLTSGIQWTADKRNF